MRIAAVTFLAGAMLVVPANALAQTADPSDRGDAADFREHDEDGEPEPYEYGLDGMPKPSRSLNISAPLLFDTNPAWASSGSSSALLFAPSVAVRYSHPGLMPGWDLQLDASADADLFSKDPDEVNEARLTARATLFHELEDTGTFSLRIMSRWTYVGEDFSQFDHAQQRYTVSFAPNISDKVGASVSAEYRASPEARERRFVGTGNIDVTLVESKGLRLGFFQELAFSRFTGGSNDGRTDLLSLSELLLTPNWSLPNGMRLSFAASLNHRFSNRERSRFTALQVGPTLGWRF
ncbi:hypothetical protein GCM10023264_12750 [Sphingomonas daechungensis]|uniref:hypothetical protein n=1 Tax=Sphingomonas daechungensis TaxID=1176646 RepID=UPI0031EA7542